MEVVHPRLGREAVVATPATPFPEPWMDAHQNARTGTAQDPSSCRCGAGRAGRSRVRRTTRARRGSSSRRPRRPGCRADRGASSSRLSMAIRWSCPLIRSVPRPWPRIRPRAAATSTSAQPASGPARRRLGTAGPSSRRRRPGGEATAGNRVRLDVAGAALVLTLRASPIRRTTSMRGDRMQSHGSDVADRDRIDAEMPRRAHRYADPSFQDAIVHGLRRIKALRGAVDRRGGRPR